MTDIVSRLRLWRDYDRSDTVKVEHVSRICGEAAEEIERLRKDNKELCEENRLYVEESVRLRGEVERLKKDYARY